MKKEEYSQLYKLLTSRDAVIDQAKKNASIGYNTLLCIYSQKYQEHTKKTHNMHRTPKKMAEYFQRYSNGEDIVSIAEEVNIAPCLLARIILRCYVGFQESQVNATEYIIKSKVSKYMKEPSLIDDERLKTQVEQCIQCDDAYSPLVDKIRHTTGLEYEYILQERLNNMGIEYSGEDELRAQGLPKTPDVKLNIPIAIKLSSGEDWFIVNWIESKASFGDESNHEGYAKDQLLGYHTRYGTGIVIYWFGFIDELQEVWKKKGILILDRFPPPTAIIEALKTKEES